MKRSRLLAAFGVFATVFFMASGFVSAQAVTRAYQTDTTLQRGMIVRLDAKDNTKVVPVAAKDMDQIEGVVVAANDSPVTLSEADSTVQQVFVATTGRYEVLVSNQNGTINKDDYITVSALDGVGMKADGNQSRVIGRALTGFDGKSGVVGQTTVKNSANVSIPISLGLIGVEISIGRNPLETKKQSIIPGLEKLQQAAGTVTNNQVTPGQVYLGLAVLVLTTIVAGSILYAGVRTSMIAIGRNPLARGSVMRNLVQVVVTSVIILIIGIVAVYLILKL